MSTFDGQVNRVVRLAELIRRCTDDMTVLSMDDVQPTATFETPDERRILHVVDHRPRIARIGYGIEMAADQVFGVSLGLHGTFVGMIR